MLLTGRRRWRRRRRKRLSGNKQVQASRPSNEITHHYRFNTLIKT